MKSEGAHFWWAFFPAKKGGRPIIAVTSISQFGIPCHEKFDYKASVLIVTFFVDISAFHDNLSRIFSMFCDIFKLRNFIMISDFRVTIFEFWRYLIMYQITDDCTKLSSRLWTIFNLFTFTYFGFNFPKFYFIGS